MSAVEKGVDRRNDTVTIVGDTYCVEARARYVTAIQRADGRLSINAHMTREEAEALLAGLQEALG